MNIGNKSILAKLLATENVSVEHQKVPTAYFDLKERKVVLPIFNDMSPDLYDLLIGHEVSHALNTPLDGWHDSVNIKGTGFKSFLNVVEDARIEADIKKRYPGLVKNFFRGYKELYEMDFFGLNGRNINEYPLIDRINIHFKVGMFAAVDFTNEELIFVDKVAKCETWEDVLAVATELYEFSKEEEAMINMSDDIQVSDDNYELSDEQGEFETGEGEETEEKEETKQNGSSSDQDSGGEETDGETEETVASENYGDNESNFDPASITDQNFRKNEDQLIDTNAGTNFYGNFPKLDYKKWIEMDPWKNEINIPFKKYEKGSDEYSFIEVEVDKNDAVKQLNANFRNKNLAFINMMVSQFESKRKAAQFAKSRENKTGLLNSNKLWATKLTEDIFLSNTIVPDGKNHGMIMVVDFSGSMYDKFSETIEQLLVQVSFCKKVNIPFEVYSFTEEHWGGDKKYLVENQKEGDIKITDAGLKINKLISSDMTPAKYKSAFNGLLTIATAYGSSFANKITNIGLPFISRLDVPVHLRMGGTPLAETILLLRDVAIDFRQKNNIDVLNTLFLTDGDNTGTLDMGKQSFPYYKDATRKDAVVIQEGGITTYHRAQNKYYSLRLSSLICQALIKHYDATTGSRTINYFLSNSQKSELKFKFYNVNGYDEAKFEKQYKAEWLTDGFIQMNGLDGFPTAFVLHAKDLGNVEELNVSGDKKGDLVRGFKKFQKSKTTSRKFLTKFIEKIA